MRIKFLVWFLTLCASLVARAATYYGSVGETIILSVPNVTIGYVDKALWGCSSPCISFISKDETQAEIKIVKAFSGTVQVELVYVQTWMGDNGKRQQNTYTKYFDIQCKGGGAQTKSISIPDLTRIKMGDDVLIPITIDPEGSAPGTISWSVTTPGIVSVGTISNDSMKVFSRSLGTTGITLTTSSGLSCSGKVEVYDPDIKEMPVPTKIILPDRITMQVGQTFKLTPFLFPSNAVTSLDFSKSGFGYAIKVELDGTVVANEVGKSSVRVETYNGKYSGCSVNVVHGEEDEETCSAITYNTVVKGMTIKILKDIENEKK